MNKQPQYAILSVLTILLIALAILTVLPHPASHPNLLGYKSLCAFVPLSTLILLGLAGFCRIFRDISYKAERPRERVRTGEK